MKSLLIPTLCLLLSARSFAASPLDEDHLPFNARTTSEIEAGGRVLPAGTPFVLIRLEEGRVVADVSRVGVVRIPLAQTDALQVERAETEAAWENAPRMFQFLVNKLAGGEPDWRTMLKPAEVAAFRSWIFFYGRGGDADTVEAARVAAEIYGALPAERRAQTALVFMDVDGDAAAIQSLADAVRPAFQTMPGYLARGYVRSFDHWSERTPLPFFTEVAGSGRILSTNTGLDGLATYLRTVTADPAP